jgi:enoyl-CoA hydratase/carnithine racemase
MAYDSYSLLKIEQAEKIVTATIDNPPINLVTLALYGELAALARELEADADTRVFVLKSANPDFFLAHFDVEAILAFPTGEPATRAAAARNDYHALCERFRTMNAVTIAQIEGRVGGGGSELCMAFDMRFGVKDKTIVNQMEVPIGILPGGGGTQRLPRLVGRGRALEIVLGGIDLDAETAERWGWLNRALSRHAIGPHVEKLARRIASFPPEAVRLAKQAVDAADRPLAEGLAEESYLFQRLLRTKEAQATMKRFLELGGQTREGEMKIAELSGKAAKG